MRVVINPLDKHITIYLQGDAPDQRCAPDSTMRAWFYGIAWPKEGADWYEFFPIGEEVPWSEGGALTFYMDDKFVGSAPIHAVEYDYATGKNELWYDLTKRRFPVVVSKGT